MALNAEPADPQAREQHHLPPKSYADAAEEALLQDDHQNIDEAAIKETPPRPKQPNHVRKVSQPRALGEIFDEVEKTPPPGSPLLRHPKGRLENKSSHETYADITKDTTPATNSKANKTTNGMTNGKEKDVPNGTMNGTVNGNGAKYAEPLEPSVTFDGVGKDEEPRTPTRKAHRRLSSRSPNSESIKKRMRAEMAVSGAEDEDAKPGALVYENLWNKSGENLASVKPPRQEYDLSLQQRSNKDTSSPHSDSLQAGHTQQQLVSGRHAGAGWSKSAIRWAPLNVPLQRRLQTLVVLMHTLSIVGFLAFFFVICAIPLMWPLVVPYLIYLTFSRASVDGELAHRSEWLRRSKIWSLFGAYFPARLHRSQELEPTRKYIFGYHPHGIISHGAFVAFGTEALGFGQLFPGITNTLLTLDANFSTPLYREYMLRMGLASVCRESCENLLSKGGINGEGMGRAITIVIGGARESLDATPYKMKLVLKRRKGFVKLAIRTGADLVPVLAFGENDLYEQLDGNSHPFVHKVQLLVKKFMGFTIPLFHARGVFNYDVGIMPYRRPVNIVVGKPIPIQQSSNPDPKYVEEMHAQYVKELMGIWEAWKDVFAPNRTGELEMPE